MRAALEASQKQASALDLVGCTVELLKQHIEQQFTENMSWDNRSEWHVDHIVPLSSFDLSDIETQKKAFHWTNLQPLWEADSLAKGSKIPENRVWVDFETGWITKL